MESAFQAPSESLTNVVSVRPFVSESFASVRSALKMIVSQSMSGIPSAKELNAFSQSDSRISRRSVVCFLKLSQFSACADAIIESQASCGDCAA